MRNSMFWGRNALAFVILIVLLVFGEIESAARKRVVLTAKKSITSQILTTDKGALYIVQENIDLKKRTVKLPQDAILHFDGGMISNGELVGNNSTIDAGRYRVFNSVSFSGTWSLDGLPVEWFGACPNTSNLDCSSAINEAILMAKRIGTAVVLGSGIYYTKSTIDIPETGTLIGVSPTLTTICYLPSVEVGVYMHGQYTTIRNICVEEYKKERNGICIKLGDLESKESCTRGFIENVKAIGGNRGLDLEYQWCNKISGINSRYNNIGLYANETTPFVENAIIEGNYLYGVFSEGAGIKMYNAVIEGNRIGCVLNGRENVLNNCYFEENTDSFMNKNAKKSKDGVDEVGGHIYAGENNTINSLTLIGCLFGDARKANNTVRVDNCQSFTSMGCSPMKWLKTTKKCKVSYVDDRYFKSAK